MLKSVRFKNFKCLRDFTVNLRDMNVFVGPNNAGKSTILDAFRILGAYLAFAGRRNPSIIRLVEGTADGYEIPLPQLPISMANIHSDYKVDQETSIIFS